eukprot:5635115-Prymnesium_polylepis.2
MRRKSTRAPTDNVSNLSDTPSGPISRILSRDWSSAGCRESAPFAGTPDRPPSVDCACRPRRNRRAPHPLPPPVPARRDPSHCPTSTRSLFWQPLPRQPPLPLPRMRPASGDWDSG